MSWLNALECHNELMSALDKTGLQSARVGLNRMKRLYKNLGCTECIGHEAALRSTNCL